MNWQDKIAEVYEKWMDNSEFFEIRTSGSTGVPKNIKLEKRKMEASAKMSLEYFNLVEGDTALLALPADKVGGVMLIIRSIVGNLDLKAIEPKLNPFIYSEIEEHIAFCSLTPAQLATALKDEKSYKQLRRIDKVLLGGSAVTQELLDRILTEENHYYHSYGMTETISHVAVRDLSAGDLYFKALDGVSFETNHKNQLIIGAPSILPTPLLTNDLVELIDEQKMIWKGRIDNVINSGGVKIIVEQVEEEIRKRYNGIFYLVGVPDKVLGEAVVMISQSPGPDFSFLPKFHRPGKVVTVAEFKYTENGKLLRLTPQQLSDL